MNVLYLSATGALGGAEKVLLGVMKAVRRAQPDVKLHLVSLSHGPLVEQAVRLGARVTVLPLPVALASLGDSQPDARECRTSKILSLAIRALGEASEAGKFLRRFRHTIKNARPQLIHSNGIKTHALTWLAGPEVAPVLWHVHDFFGARPTARPLLRLAARRAAGAIAVSRAVAADLRTLWTAAPIQVIPNAVDVHEYSPGAQNVTILDMLAHMSPIGQSCVRVGLVATYAHWKGHTVFLEAASRLLQAAPALPVRFYIIGGPIYAAPGSQHQVDALQALTRQLGLARHVGYIGFQQEVVPIYRALDVVVNASTAPEPFGMTIIEAMACGRAVIAAQAGGAAEIFQSGHDALGVPPAKVQPLADALHALIGDGPLRHQLGAEARRSVCSRFNQERLGRQILGVYQRLCGVSRAADGVETLTCPNPSPILHAGPA